MEHDILPRQAANPSHIRLDGMLSGGNREVAGQFVHGGKIWRIHADTRYEPLKLAYHALKTKASDPFKQSTTKKDGRRLDLKAAIQRPGARHLYIYQVPAGNK
jgi:hypothetical protein